MQIGELYQFVLLLVMVALITGVGIVVLNNFSTASGIGATASTAVNSSITALAAIPNTWLSLIVTISVLGIILGIVINSFATKR